MTSAIRIGAARACALAAALLLAAGPARGSEDSLARRKYHVRIAVQRNVERVAVEGRGSYQAVNPKGKAIYTLKSGELHFVDIVRGRSGGFTYRLVIRELDSHQEENAVQLARAARRAYDMPAKALRLPAPEAEGGSRLLVTIGEFKSLEEARAAKDKVGAEKVTHIFEEKTPAREGQVILRDGRGRTVASDDESLRLVPYNLTEHSLYVEKIAPGAAYDAKKIVDARHYRGDVDLAIDEEGGLTVVNTLWIEYYLYGVVAAEIGNDAPAEALRAQAVVARSEAVAKIERGIVAPSPLYDFTDSALIQAYKGKGYESKAVREAVDATRGEILVWDGRAVDAVYSHSCGGVISTAGDMWDSVGAEYSRRKADRLRDPWIGEIATAAGSSEWTERDSDVFCNPNQPGFPNYAKSSFRWSKTFTRAQMQSFFGVGRVKDVVIERRTGSGRVRAVKIVGEKDTVVFDRELSIRDGLGAIKSTFFTIEKETGGEGGLEKFTIHGAGYGHGVGLCQMGAYMMALKNFSYRQILGHYYSEVKIRRLYG